MFVSRSDLWQRFKDSMRASSVVKLLQFVTLILERSVVATQNRSKEALRPKRMGFRSGKFHRLLNAEGGVSESLEHNGDIGRSL